GQSISETHQGREVMRTGREMVQTAELVRGNIMNCMHPIIRNGEVIGYIWANELMEDINDQVDKMENRFFLAIFLGMLLSFAGSAVIAHSVVSRVNLIKNGLQRIQEDLSYRIPPVSGEIGEIADAINVMAGALEERKQLQEHLQRADRLAAIGEIAAGVAHEIRNPLTSIKGFVQFIEEELDEYDHRLEYTKIIIREVDRVNKIVNELLYYARPSESQITLADVNRVLEDTLVLVNIKMLQPGITLRKKLAHDLPPVLMDEEQIKQVFLNLIINSIQAIEDSGEITIETGQGENNRFVQVAFHDTGVGIPPDLRAKIFDPFFTTRKKGTGLGLAVVSKIVENHGGFIEVSSQPGRGSTFVVSLPIPEEGDKGAQRKEDTGGR
ncbi:MAG: ATP-binding protein, partial [Syntrophomonadaceae bacterium]|nr:ATP-binding protein [Syntrophomonadaceae bacterium]